MGFKDTTKQPASLNSAVWEHLGYPVEYSFHEVQVVAWAKTVSALFHISHHPVRLENSRSCQHCSPKYDRTTLFTPFELPRELRLFNCHCHMTIAVAIRESLCETLNKNHQIQVGSAET